MAAKGRIRKGRDRFQGVSLEDNWRTQWFKNEDTAQRHLDEHLEKLKGGGAKKSGAGNDGSERNAENEFVEQGASDIPPGGQNTGPRG